MILYNTKVAGKVLGPTWSPDRRRSGTWNATRQPMISNPVYGWRTFGTTTFPSGVW